MNFDAAQIAEYLRTHPEFFEENIGLLTDVDIPHPHGGRAISIGERQVLALREKNRAIETKLAELIQFGEENDAISEKIHRLACALIGCNSIENVLATIYAHMQEKFSVPHTLVRLWNHGQTGSELRETVDTPVEVREFVAAMKTPYCGTHAVYETNHWFGDGASHLKSFAMVRLHGDQPFGVLLLASEDQHRFYPEMGTLYLNRIGELVSTAIEAHLS